jgi:DNA invertase Pin-like site-specific DNA recombinase
MCIYGYCRVSTRKQELMRQEKNIKELYPDAVIIKEKYTGTSMNREEWQKLIKRVNNKSTIVFDSVSRMSRNAQEGFEAYEELYARGVNLVFIKEPHINTEVYRNAINNSIQKTGGNVDYIIDGINKYLMALAREQIKIAFEQAEKEVIDIRARVKEGQEIARLNGKQIGGVTGAKYKVKKSAEAKEIILKHSKTFGGNLNDTEVMKLTGLSRNTYYKYKKELTEGQ